MNRTESNAIGGIIHELTSGKPYVFVIMTYNSRYAFFEHIAGMVRAGVGLACIRADHVKAAGHDLLAKIHLLIERAELVIAEISDPSPNVFYEVGYAVAHKKPLLLLVRQNTEIPTDLKGRELIEYTESQKGMTLFDDEFCAHLKQRVNSQTALLRDMLEAETPQPAYIVASPKYPEPSTSRILGQVYDRRTFGDNLGVLGLLSAFGAMMGETRGVELISAQYGPRDLIDADLNLYLIGSRKVNPIAGAMLRLLQGNRQPQWCFDPYPGEKEDENWRVALYRTPGDNDTRPHGKTESRHGGIVHTLDHGIIVRGPHPHHPRRLVLIMAGAHSLGSGAACLAATRSPLILKIKESLQSKNVDIADKKRTFWVLVKGEANKTDGLLDVEGVSIVETGVYD